MILLMLWCQVSGVSDDDDDVSDVADDDDVR